MNENKKREPDSENLTFSVLTPQLAVGSAQCWGTSGLTRGSLWPWAL